MKNRRGFSMVEVLIVMFIMGILATFTTFTWNRYSSNANLRSAARDVQADMANAKEKARSESRIYKITFDDSSNNNYVISYAETATPTVFNTYQTKTPRTFDADIAISAANFSGTKQIFFRVRGTSDPNGTVTLRNSRGSTAVITVSTTGKAYVTFNMQ